jgi:hypothetical protein
MVSMNKLDRAARARILHLLCEGSSIRAITRLTGASKNTVIKREQCPDLDFVCASRLACFWTADPSVKLIPAKCCH